MEAIDRFNDLGLEDDTEVERIDHMSVMQLDRLAVANAQAGREATARALQIATETREIGHQTAQSMHHQTRQLEAAGENFQVVHDYLDKSERTSMYSNNITSLTRSPFTFINKPLT